jgi:hypothetical protein
MLAVGRSSHRPGRLRRCAELTCLVGVACTLLSGLSCPPKGTVQSRETPNENSITLFFTGDEQGALKPCGCSGGQLGGLEKRPAVFNTIPASRRMTIETGGLVPGDGAQDLIKFRIFLEAFGLIGYDVVHLTARDATIRENLGLAQDTGNPYKTIAAQWPPGPAGRPGSISKEFTVAGRSLSVVVGSADAKADPVEKAIKFWETGTGQILRVLILQNADDNLLGEWVAKSGADCIVCPSRTDDPQVLSSPKARPLVFSTGRFGRHISRLDVAFSPQSQAPEMQLKDIRVDEKLANDEALVRLYKQYQTIVKESGFLETYRRVPLPSFLQYIGSKSCESCHLYEYTLAMTQRHANAFATLEKVGSDGDPECVICHVVGMDRETGFVTPEKTPHLKNVGCEVCHGPASEHVRGGGRVPTTEPKIACVQCHTPEHSGGYAGHEDEYRKKIMHWMEP